MISPAISNQTPYNYRKLRSQEAQRPTSSQKSIFQQLSPTNYSKSIDAKSNKFRITRRSERKSNISKFNFTPDEQTVYEEFARLLSAFEPEDMCELLADVLKDAKGMMFK